jgi:hypothetical protein
MSSIFISAVQAVAAAAQLREIRQAAYADVRQFRDLEAAGGITQARRRTLERIADQLGDLELELSYSVEATADLGLLVPSLRAESFHNALYDSMSLASKAVTAGKTLQRLAAAISAELTALESVERRADDNRRARWYVQAIRYAVQAVQALPQLDSSANIFERLRKRILLASAEIACIRDLRDVPIIVPVHPLRISALLPDDPQFLV